MGDVKHGGSEKAEGLKSSGSAKGSKGHSQIMAAAKGSKGSRSSAMIKSGSGSSKQSTHGQN